MEPPERVAASPPLNADESVSQSAGQTSTNQLGGDSQSCASQDQRQSRLETDGWESQQLWGVSFQPEFQDSNLSPALPLLPANSGVERMFAEYSLFQHSDNDFAPLRAYPDVSMASERFHFPPHDGTSLASECGSLSQHPLAQATVLSEEEETNTSCSLSQHSLLPGDDGRPKERVETPPTGSSDRQAVPPGDNRGCRAKDSGTLIQPPDKPVNKAGEDETFFLSKDVPVQHLLVLLQRDIGMPSSSSSAVSSASETSVQTATSFTRPDINPSAGRREGPPGEASLPQQQTQQPDRDLCPDRSRTSSSQICNVSMGLRSTQPDERCEELRRELLSEVEMCNRREAESKSQKQISPTTQGQPFTPYPTEMSERKPSVTRAHQGGVPWTGPFSAGVERGHREQDLWSSGNQTGIDGSYLGFLPQSQSTPGVFKVPQKSNVKNNLRQLSAIESSKENSSESNVGISPQQAVPAANVHQPGTSNQDQEEATSAKVQSLPSLNYLQKVDAWRANQTSGKTSLFDSLALQGFSGISPKKKAYEAVSDTLNRILSQQARSLQQPPASSATNQNVTQSPSTAPSGSSSTRRGEAVGSAPSDKDNTGSAAKPSASSFGRSHSHSSLSTVVMSVKKDQQAERRTENEEGQSEEDVLQPGATAQPSPLEGLGRFSDVSLDRDLTLSSSQGSYTSGVKLGTSIGASSVVSLEVDNYAPYWTSKLSTPPPLPRTRELNIEERIPLYLHNLGIDQSPSTILTPFAPRGPIREPEFSPTDLCTIKGSVGTPTKSAQPSEGGSPHKGEFSRSSILSVDSSMSVPFSMDSLGPAASIPERPRRASPLSDTDDIQSEPRLASSSSSADEDSDPSALQAALRQQRDGSLTSSQSTVQPGDRFDSEAKRREDFESPLQTSRSLEQSAAASFVSSAALLEIRKLLTQAENVVSAGSSASTGPAAARLLSDDDIFLSLRKKTSRLQDSSFSSLSATDNPGTRSSLLWARSSSDSMLTSEKLRESSVGRESVASPGQPPLPSTPPAAGAHRRPGDNFGGGGAASSFVLSQSARRAEPEGCSAAPPNNTVPPPPPPPPALRPPPAPIPQQLASTPADTTSVTDDERQGSLESPVPSSSPSPVMEDADQGVMSDGSSESSLAVRVAKLLQSESPATMMSSTPSVTDQEEGKAREWIKLKLSGQQCEPLELDKEDRDRIEEIKRELLLKNPMKSQGSTDTESSAASSIRVRWGQDLVQRAEPLAALAGVNTQPSQPLQSISTDPSDSSVQLRNPPHPDLEAQIREIAAREGVTLPKTNPRALTSITIATRRRSTSPSPCTSPAPPLSPAPEPLRLTELSTGAGEHPEANRQLPPTAGEDEEANREPAVFDLTGGLYTRNQNLTPRSASRDQRRQDAVGGQFEDPSPPARDLGCEDVTATNKQSLRRDDEGSVPDSSVSGAGHEAEQATGSSTCGSPARTGHVSHVRLTLSPKAAANAAAAAAGKDYAPLRPSSSAASSPDEGVGLSSPPEWYDNREPVRQDTSTLFKKRTTSTQFVTPRRHRMVSPRPSTADSPVPVLLPYKPKGSEKLFYVPQTETDFSSTDTTMESTHTGSDDAVPPRFSSEVLGHRDPGLDRGVTIRHTEGIYSKRLKTTTFKMLEPAHRGASSSTDETSQTQGTPKPPPQVSVAFTRVPPSRNQVASTRDQGTSPVQLHSYERVHPVHVARSPAPRDQAEQDQKTSTGTLDQLWQRFCDRWSLEESRPTSDREASLLERLERLSRLIHSSKGANMSECWDPEEKPGRRRDDATGRERGRHTDEGRRSTERRGRGGRKDEGAPPIPHQAWTQQVETSPPAGEDSFTSGVSHGSSHSELLGPADVDESDTLSTASGSMSTVDTARLIRAFGAHRVRHLKTSSGLGKLYGTINRQRDGREQRRGGNATPPEAAGSDESTVATDSASSSSTYTVPSHRGPSRSLAAKKAVRLVSKGVQAGHLELVSNGTRRHTRDVGTTFPSPAESRTSRHISSSSSGSERGRGGRRTQSQGLQKHGKSRKSSPKLYPQGVSWFISADDLRSDARKENRPEEDEPRPSAAWFEPYSRTKPWREPLRPRQVHQEANKQLIFTHQAEPDVEPRTKTLSSALTRISLQEALAMHRPDFISQSRRRVKRLALQAEERKLQEVFSREREELFSRPGGPGRLPRPAGTAQLRRAVPRKEMIQRSKQIYETLPEVQRRREEERRKAEYRSYRLNAQLYNKRITSRVLGRRSVC